MALKLTWHKIEIVVHNVNDPTDGTLEREETRTSIAELMLPLCPL